MKLLLKIKIVLLSLLFMDSNAQTTFPKDGDNIKNPHLDKFIGTWVWKNGNEELTFIFKKENVKLLPTAHIYGDALYGFHRYVKDGKEIENSTQYKNTAYSDKKHSIFSVGGNKPTELGVSISHLSKSKSINCDIEYIDNKRIKLKKLENLHGIRILREGEKFDYTISLPQDIILTKKVEAYTPISPQFPQELGDTKK